MTATPPMPGVPPKADLRLLLVDDDEEALVLVRALVAEMVPTWTVDWSPTYEEGIESHTTGNYDATLLDVQLGAHTGLELLEAVRDVEDLPPIVMLTGQGDRATDLAAMATGAADYLDKGFLSPAILERTVRNALERERVSAELRNGGARKVEAATIIGAPVRTSEAQFRRALDGLGLHALILDPDGGILFANRHLLARTGWTSHDLTGADAFSRLSPDDEPAANRDAYSAGVAAGAILDRIESTMRTRTGERVQVSWTNSPIRDDNGSIIAVALVGEDVSARLEAEAMQARLVAAMGQAAESIILTDIEGRVIYANPAFERLSGYAVADVIGKEPRTVVATSGAAAAYPRIGRRLLSGRPWRGEWALTRRDGSSYREEVTISPVRDGRGAIVNFVRVGRDVTHLRQVQTSLDNSTRGRVAFAHALARLRQGDTPEATGQAITDAMADVAGIDVAALLSFEDADDVRVLAVTAPNGHPIPVVQLLAPAMAAYMRARAAQGPWVEAGVRDILDGQIAAEFDAMGLKAMALAPIGSDDGPIGLIALGTSDDLVAARIQDQLPAAIEFAAAAGSLIAGPLAIRRSMQTSRRRIRAVIAAGALDPVFQPIVDLATGRAVGYEALTRFKDGTRPDMVFAEAGSAGVGHELEAATLTRTMEDAHALPQGPWLALNVSAALIVEHEPLARILERRPGPIVLEITEHDAIADYAAVRAAIALLGPDILVAVDDAGAGVANFTHIVELRPDFVKVDMGLVRGVDHDLARQALIVGLRHFAKATGGLVIAEGVETNEERDALMGLDLELGQGFLFGRPAPAEAWTTTDPIETVAGSVRDARSGRRARLRGAVAAQGLRR